MKNHWQLDLDSMKKKWKIYTKKQMVILGNLLSQLRVLDSSQHLYALLFLAFYCSSTHTLSLKTLRKTPPFSFHPFFSSLIFLPFSLSRICLTNDLCCSRLFCHLFSVSPPCNCLFCHLFGHHLFCLTPSAASKSLWPLRMRHVARWDSDTWLKMWSAKQIEKEWPMPKWGSTAGVFVKCHSILRVRL